MQTGIYKHYKGNLYEVLFIAKHTETLEDLVVYKALYNSEEFGDNALWVRPKNMFIENIKINGKTIPRFEYIGNKDYNYV